ncbi:MAG TPA: sulfurtransferase [Bacteroidales bacterium]|nr:sulfurtransferase [Bacteroidales bacterium]
MEKSISPILQPDELKTLLNNNIDLVLIDARGGIDARERYNKGHLLGSIFVDLDTQLADIKESAANGGRHPLPQIQKFAELLGRLGIDPETDVIVYDDAFGGNCAARFWWMIKAVGHMKIQVLNGGLQTAEQSGFKLTTDQPVLFKTTVPYPITDWKLPLVTIDAVEEASLTNNRVIIDVRAAERYQGITEPIDLIAGHIPNAINFPYFNHLNPNGTYQSPEEIRKIYDDTFENYSPDQIIVHCGSGVTACHTLLAFDFAGYQIPNLYMGSWSEWSRNNKPIAKSI